MKLTFTPQCEACYDIETMGKPRDLVQDYHKEEQRIWLSCPNPQCPLYNRPTFSLYVELEA